MTTPTEEEQLRETFLAQGGIGKDASAEPLAAQEAIQGAMQQANVQTGIKDLLVLAVSSFFTLVQMLMAPFVVRVLERVDKPRGTEKTPSDTQHQ